MSERRWVALGLGGWGGWVGVGGGCQRNPGPPPPLCPRRGKVRGGEDLETRVRSVSERLPGRQLSLTPLRLDSFSINSLSVDEWSLLDWVFIELARSEQDSRAVRYIEFTSESSYENIQSKS